MYFNEVVIENYKCFRDPSKLKLEKGINLIIGQNNVGKTSMLETLELRFENNPHQSYETYEKSKRSSKNYSKITIEFTLSNAELIDSLIIKQNQNQQKHKFPLNENPDLIEINEDDDSLLKDKEAQYRAMAKEYFSNDWFTFRLFNDRTHDQYDNWQVPDDPYIDPKVVKAYDHDRQAEFHIEFSVDSVDEFNFYQINQSNVGRDGRHRDDFIRTLGQPLHQHIYRFRAERVPFEACSLGTNKNLSPNASNLAEVLNLLNHSQLKKFNELITEIFPNIYQVDIVKLDEENKGQVRIWNDPQGMDNDDLGFTLDKCGSGVGQVLAILYVILNKDPKVILIDEPQSFLHPNAARKLIEIIRNHGSHHQIVIATHSPTIITAAEPSTVTLITQKSSQSTLAEIDINQIEYQRICCGELGISFSDVFGVDKIVWVEGLTEEICFNKIRDKFLPDKKRGVVILGVRNKSDFENADKNDRKRIVDIYEKLSSAEGGLMPKAVGYIFDSEADDDSNLDKIRNLSPDRIYFTERRMYENYLLNPSAITAVINQIEDLSGSNKVKVSEIRKWMNQERKRPTYFKPLSVETNKWKNTIHGKRLLKELFDNFCVDHSNRNYKEKIHAVLLTEWLLENSEKDLEDISKLIKKAINY